MNNIQKADMSGHLCRIILTNVIFMSKVRDKNMCSERRDYLWIKRIIAQIITVRISEYYELKYATSAYNPESSCLRVKVATLLEHTVQILNAKIFRKNG